jgi:farnesyl diphosphate synthase
MPELPQRLTEFDAALRAAIAATCVDAPSSLRQALAYAVLNGGKRIRPQCCLTGAHVWQVPIEAIIPVAVSVELIHAQSLVHDDLPCMDDDDERRGQPTLHKAFDEGIAVLAGDALLAHAFAVLTKPDPALTRDQQARLVFELSHTYQQLVSGQVMDLAAQTTLPDLLQVSSSPAMQEAVNRLKTAALFRYCFWAVAFLADLPPAVQQQWTELGEEVGLLFQRCDDWADTPWPPDSDAKTVMAQQLDQQYTRLQVEAQALHPNAKLVIGLLQRVIPSMPV